MSFCIVREQKCYHISVYINTVYIVTITHRSCNYTRLDTCKAVLYNNEASNPKLLKIPLFRACSD